MSLSPLPVQLTLFPEFNTLSVMYGEPLVNFITQESPYVLGAVSTREGAGGSGGEGRGDGGRRGGRG